MKGEVKIGNDVWCGAHAVIMSGVKIGNGAVIGAFSVVRRDIPPYAIAIGNPARIAGYRFSPEKIEQLEQIAWWDWPLDKIKKELPILHSGEIDSFTQKHNLK